MDPYESDREDVDRLVRQLLTDRPGPGQPAAVPAAAPVVAARLGSRWSNVRLLMPLRRGPGIWERLAREVRGRLPELPRFDRFLRMPGPTTMVRVWVGLGAVQSAAMTFWPYPKSYQWGLVLYILSLGVALVAGIWGARLTWDARLGSAHTVALGSAIWAVTLAAAEAMPLV